MNFHVVHKILNPCNSENILQQLRRAETYEQHVTKRAKHLHLASIIPGLATSSFISYWITNYAQKCLLNCFMVYYISIYKILFCSSLIFHHVQDRHAHFLVSGSLQSLWVQLQFSMKESKLKCKQKAKLLCQEH